VARLEIPEAPPGPQLPAPVPPSVAAPAPKAAATAPDAAPPNAALPDATRRAKAEVRAAFAPQAPKDAPAAAPPEVPEAPEIAAGARPDLPVIPQAAPLIVVPGAQGFAQGDSPTKGTLAVPLQPVAPAPAPAGGGGRGGGRGGRGGGGGGRGAAGTSGGAAAGGVRALAQPQAAQPARFGFDYTVTQAFVLRVFPYANGFLSVNVMKATTSESPVSGRRIQAGTVTEVQLPDDSVFITVVFSAQEKIGGFGGDIPGGSDPLSGTKSDPNPSPNSVLFALIQLRR
jgi:hypothetical protein